MYEYRFVVDGKVVVDPENKNKSESGNTSILFLDERAKNKVLDKKKIDVNLIGQTISELVANQKKLLDELSLIRAELVKKDLQIELLRTQMDKFNIENRDKQKVCETMKSQYDQLAKNFEDAQLQIKKLQSDATSFEKSLKLKQKYYADCMKTNQELKKSLKKLVKRLKTMEKKVSKKKSSPLQISENTKPDANKTTEEPKQKASYTKIGKIYEVSSTTNIAIIYVGENSNLSKADMLYVLKNNEVVATLTVTSVEKEWCYAKIVSGSKDVIAKQDVYVISAVDETKNKSH
jgi:chromosome segregation ATPase